MTYIPSLNKFQVGLEATYADGATATIQPHGITNVRVDPHVEATQLIDKRGTTMPAHESFINKRWSEGIVEGFVDYDTFYFWLDGVFGKDTPAAGVYDYLASLDWSPEVEQSLALYYGQTGLIYKCPGVLPSEFTISGASGEPVKFAYKFFGNPAAAGASFAALTDATNVPEWAMGHNASIYIDAGKTALPGTTLVADLAFSFEANITSNRKPVWHLGDQAPDSWRNGKWGGNLKLTLEADATRLTLLSDVLANTSEPEGLAVQVRVTNGSDILKVNFVGEQITPAALITEEDGIVTAEIDLMPVYGSNAGFLSCWGAQLTLA